jgi:ankyrin repeat protein
VDAADESGCTAFHEACAKNRPECVEALVLAGCDVGMRDDDSMTGLRMATEAGHTAVVARLRTVVAEKLRVAQVRKAPSWPRSCANFSVL